MAGATQERAPTSPSPAHVAERCSLARPRQPARLPGERSRSGRPGRERDRRSRSCAKPRPSIPAPPGLPPTEGEYTWPGSNWRPSACWADVIATRPQVPEGLADLGHHRRKVKGFSTGAPRGPGARGSPAANSGYSSVGRASDCRALQLSDGPWFDSGWPDFRFPKPRAIHFARRTPGSRGATTSAGPRGWRS